MCRLLLKWLFDSLIFIWLKYYIFLFIVLQRLPQWFSRQRICKRHRERESDPWVGKIPRRREWQSTPVFLPWESHGQRSLGDYSPKGHKESDMIEWLSTPMSTHTHTMLQSGYRKDQTRGEFYIKACSLLLPLLLMDDSLFLLSSVMEHCRPWSRPLCVYITFPLVGFHCRVLTSQRGNKWQVQVKVASWWQVLGVWC